MPRSRALLLTFALLAVLAGVGTAAAAPRDDRSMAAESGGALAEPYAELEGGGNVAPGATREAEAAESDDGAASPEAAESAGSGAGGGAVAAAAQADGDETTTEGGDASGEQPANSTQSIADEELAGPAGGADAAGDLPSTGLELIAMATIGLGLLMLGAALRPSRRPTGGR